VDVEEEVHAGVVDPYGHLLHLFQAVVGAFGGVPQLQPDGVEAVILHQE